MSLLTICQAVAGRTGFPKPSFIVNNQDETAIRLFDLAQEEGKELAGRKLWQELIQEASFTTEAGKADYELATIAPGFDYMLNDTEWNRSERRKLNGPVSPAEWQRDQTYLSASIYKDYRIRNNKIWLYPTPGEAQTYYFEYVTKNWCISQNDALQSEWKADSDTAVLDEELMILGLRWRFKKSKGLSYAEDFRTYEMQVQRALGRSGAAPTLSITRKRPLGYSFGSFGRGDGW